jgi:hypothetical protein
MRFHKHHIWPQHAIGPAPKNNLLKCNIALHAFLHKLQFERWGRWEDRAAWLSLSGAIGKDEIIALVMREGAKISGKKIATHKIGIHNPAMKSIYGATGGRPKGFKISSKTKENMRKAHSGKASSQWGRFWYTNGRENRKILGCSIPQGFKRGRTIIRKGGRVW